jgi:hypothetical protein
MEETKETTIYTENGVDKLDRCFSLQMLLTPTIHTNYVDRLDAKKIQTT